VELRSENLTPGWYITLGQQPWEYSLYNCVCSFKNTWSSIYHCKK